MTKIRELSRIERPREKLIYYGPEKLSNSELLAILLRSGKRGENVVELSKRLLKKFGTENLPNLTFKDLKEFSGLGPAKACEIVACFELSKRLLKDKKSEMYLKPKDVWEQLRDLRNHKKEHFLVIYLDTKNQEIKKEVISIGTINESLVHPREVFEPAIRGLATQIILVHNHPSGDISPSEEDLQVTEKMVESGKIIGIEVIDHIIISKEGFFSFKEKGLI